MKKFLFMFLFAAAVASAFTFVVAQESTDEDGKKFVIHGEIRQRGEYNDNLSDFTDDADDTFGFFPYRTRIGAEGHFAKNVIGYVEFQAFGHFGDTPPFRAFGDNGFTSASGSNSSNFLDIPGFVGGVRNNVAQDTSNSLFFSINDVQMYQGFIGLNEIGGTNFSLKIGRQEIVRGSEMLLGDNDFYNGVSHDGAMGSWAWGNFSLDAFYTRPFQSGGILANPGNSDTDLYGVWANWGGWENGAEVAAYVLNYNSRDDAAGFVKRDFLTFGGRTARNVTGRNAFNWNLELALQTGDETVAGPDEDIKASAFEGMGEYNLHMGTVDHKFHVSAATATGDASATDDDAEAFDPLFQDNHARYGYSDLFFLSNLTAINAGYSLNLRDHTFGGDVWTYKLAEEDPTTGEDDLGKELDLFWKFAYTRNALVTVALAYFDPGDAIDSFLSPASSDKATRLYSNLRLRF